MFIDLLSIIVAARIALLKSYLDGGMHFYPVSSLMKYREASHQAVESCAEVIIVYSLFSRIHRHQRVANDEFKERPFVDAFELRSHPFSLRVC